MAYEDLLKSVEESADEKERELQRRAAVTVEEIRERGKKQAEAIRQAQVEEAKKSVVAERNKAVYLTKAENKELLIRVREESYDKAFSLARSRLSDMRTGPKYPGFFTTMLREAAESLGDQAFLIHVDPQDENLCRNTMKQLGIVGSVQADLQTAGGVVLSLPDNSVVISNTVESRLRQVKERQRHVIHAILSGD